VLCVLCAACCVLCAVCSVQRAVCSVQWDVCVMGYAWCVLWVVGILSNIPNSLIDVHVLNTSFFLKGASPRLLVSRKSESW
jgi:hypothetical protein